jgi:hypothetical protein
LTDLALEINHANMEVFFTSAGKPAPGHTYPDLVLAFSEVAWQILSGCDNR